MGKLTNKPKRGKPNSNNLGTHKLDRYKLSKPKIETQSRNGIRCLMQGKWPV